MEASPVDISLIKDEDILRKMWQETEDFGKKKEIRTHMYKLREARLRDLYSTGEVCKDIQRANTSPGLREQQKVQKISDMSTHADSLADHSFLSLKSKEIRDSESPTREVYKIGNQGWNVTSSNESSPDGKTQLVKKVAKISGTENIEGGVSAFAAKSELKASSHVDGDDNNYTSTKGFESKSLIKQEAVAGDENTQIRSSSTKSSSSSRTVSEFKSTTGDTNIKSTIGDNAGGLTVQVKDTKPVEYIDGNTKVTQETHTLPDGTIVTRTRYETVGGSSSVKKTSSSTTSTSKSSSSSTVEKKSSSVVSTTDEPSQNIVIKKTTVYDDSDKNLTDKNIHSSNVKIVKHTSVNVDRDINVDNYRSVDKIDKTHNIDMSNIDTRSDVTKVSKSTQEFVDVKNKHTSEFSDVKKKHTSESTDVKTTRDVNIDVRKTQEIVDKSMTKKVDDIKNVDYNKTDRGVIVEKTVSVSNNRAVDENIVREIDDNNFDKRPQRFEPEIVPVAQQKCERPHSQKPKETYEKSKATDGQYETTYRNDFTNKRISVDVSPTHDAFARSLRAVSPDRTSKCSSPSRGSTRSLRTSTTSLRSSTSPDKQKSPDKTNSRFSPDRKSSSTITNRRESNEVHSTTRRFSNRLSPEKSPVSHRDIFDRSPTNHRGSPEKSPINRPTNGYGSPTKSSSNRTSPEKSPDKYYSNETITKTFKIDDVTMNRQKFHDKAPKKSLSPDKFTSNNETVTKTFTITNDSKVRKSPSPDKISTKNKVGDYRRDSTTSNTTITYDSSTLTKKSRKSPSPNKFTNGDKVHRQDSVNSNSTVMIDTNVLTKKKQSSPPRSASPTTTVSEFEYVRKDEMVTDLDDMTTIIVSRVNEKRPDSLPIDTIDHKSPKEENVTGRTTAELRSPTKNKKSPTKTTTNEKDTPKDRPLKRTDTYEERCRQILGIVKDTDVKKNKSETLISSERKHDKTKAIKKDEIEVELIVDVKENRDSDSVVNKNTVTNRNEEMLDVNEMVVCEVVPDERNPKKITEEFISTEIVFGNDNATTTKDGEIRKTPERISEKPQMKTKTPTDLDIKEKSPDKPAQFHKTITTEKSSPTKTQDLGIKEFPSQIRRSPEKTKPSAPKTPTDDNRRAKPESPTNLQEFPSQVRRSPEKSLDKPAEKSSRTKTPDLGIKEFPSQTRRSPEKTKPHVQKTPTDDNREAKPQTPTNLQEFPSQIRRSPEKKKLDRPSEEDKPKKLTDLGIKEFPSQTRRSPTKTTVDKSEKPTTKSDRPQKTDLGIKEFPSQIRRSPEKQPKEKPTGDIQRSPKKTSGGKTSDVFIKKERNVEDVDSDSDESVDEKIEASKNTYESYEGRVPVDEPLFVKKFVDTMCKHDECQRMNRCTHKVVKKDSAGPYPGAPTKQKSPTRSDDRVEKVSRKVEENQLIKKDKDSKLDKTKGKRVVTSITIHPKTPATIQKSTKEATTTVTTTIKARVNKESSSPYNRVTKESPTTPNRVTKQSSTAPNRVIKETVTTHTRVIKEKPKQTPMTITRVPKESPKFVRDNVAAVTTKESTVAKSKVTTKEVNLHNKAIRESKNRTTTRHGTVPLIKPQQNGVVDSDEETRTKVEKKITRTTSEKFMKADTTGRKPERKSPTKEYPKGKCITTKSIIINNDVDDIYVKGDIIVDLQRSKSSREQTPDRLCPLPITTDDDRGAPRYPDQISEPDDSFKKPKLGEVILEDENDRVEIHEMNKITEVDRVNESDECLLSVNEKVNKFLNSAEQSKKTDSVGGTFKKSDLTDGKEEEVLSVTEKVNKFVSNVEKVLKVDRCSDLDRPKSPRMRNYDDGDLTVSDKLNKFIKTAGKVVSTENLEDKTEMDNVKKISVDVNGVEKKPANLDSIIRTPTNKGVDTYKVETCKTVTRKEPHEDETPKSTRRRPSQEDNKSTMSTTSRLRSTESILKAKALFENISKKDTPKQRDILSRPSVFSAKSPQRTPMKEEQPPESDAVCLKSTRLIMGGVKQKSPDRTTARHSRSPSRSTGGSPSPDRDTPNYMKPLDRSLRPKSPHKESVSILENIGKKSTVETTTTAFGITLKDVGRTTKNVEDIDLKLPIEDIYDLALLEEMLVRATDYELRRRIRAQIRIVKKQEEETSRISTTKKITPKEITPKETKKIERQGNECKFSSSATTTTTMTTERRSSTTTTSTTTSTSNRRSQSPMKDEPFKTTTKVFTELKKTAPTEKKATKSEQPEWITQNRLKKASERKTIEKVTTAAVKKVDTTKKRQSPVKETKPIDVITSSYGTGPVDENGTPLFGLKALRVKNSENTTKVQGSVTESKFYCESGREPVGEVRHTAFSTDPKDLDLGDDVSTTEGLTVVTTTKKFGQHESQRQRNEQKAISDKDVRTTTKVTRRGSVKALSQKFIENAVETSKNERQTTYPKAGLILRTSSFKNEKNGTAHKDDSSEDETKRTVSSSSSTSMMTVKTNVAKSDGSTFLTNRTRVTGVQDVIDRMRNSEEIQQGDTLEDAEARTLLNKFLGSQVLLSGMEEMCVKRQTQTQVQSQSPISTISKQTSTKITTTTTTGGKPTTVTRVFQHPVTEKELESVWDEQTLRLLLEQSTEYEERRIIRARLRQVMAEQEACTELVERASREQAGGKIEGESLLLPLLQGLLDAPEKEQTADSGTESGEDLRSGLIMEVQCALEKLAASLKNDTTDITPERRNSLLQLVSKLQAGLSSQAGSTTEKDVNTSRFGRKRQRQNRHTVGVSSEELANARRLMEEISFNDTDNVVKQTNNSLQKQNSESCVGTSGQNNNTFRSVKAAEVKTVVKNAAPKPFSASTSTASSLDTPTESLDFLFSSELPQVNAEITEVVQMRDKINRQYSLENEKKQNSYRRPLSEAVSLDCTREFDPNTVHQAATLKKLQSSEVDYETDDDPSTVKAPPVRPAEPEEKLNKFVSKKLKMKRANTIDIPKPQNFYEYIDNDDSDSSLPEQDHNQRRRSNYLALRGPIRVGQPGGGGSKVPNFEPKTESDKKFMAFINKHNEANNVKNTLWTAGQSNRGVWNNKFDNIKGAFEKVTKSATPVDSGGNVARNFWKSAEENRAPSRGFGNVKSLQESFERKLPWTDPKNVVTGSIPLRVEPKAFHLSPKPINKFSHAPASAFKPIAKKSDGPLFLYSPKPPFSPQTDSSNSSPVLPWSQNQEHRVLSIAAQKFEQPKQQPEPQGFKPKKLPVEKWSYVEKPTLPQINRSADHHNSSVRKLSGQYEAFGANPSKQTRLQQEEPKMTKGDFNEVRSKWMNENRTFSNGFGREPKKIDIKKTYCEQPSYEPPSDTKRCFYKQPTVRRDNFENTRDYSYDNGPYLPEPDREYVSTVQFNPRRSPQTPQSGDSGSSRSPQNYTNVYLNKNTPDNLYHHRNLYSGQSGDFYGNRQNLYDGERMINRGESGSMYQNVHRDVYRNDDDRTVHPNKNQQSTNPQDLYSYPNRVSDDYQSNHSGVYQNQISDDAQYRFLYQPSKSPLIDHLYESKVGVVDNNRFQQSKSDDIKRSPPIKSDDFGGVDKYRQNNNNVKPKYDTQSSQESVHEYMAVTTKVMASPISCQAVTVRQKSPMSRDEHDLEAAFNLKQALRKFSQPDTKVSPTKTPEPPVRSKTPETKTVFKPITQSDPNKTTPKFCVNDKPLESHEVNARGETIVTTKFQIPVRRVPSPSQILSKSDSWHQICNQPQHKPSPTASPIAKKVLKSKSSNTLAVPKQFEAGMSKEEMQQKKKTMEAFFGSGGISDKSTTSTAAATKKSSINRIRTSQKLSISSGLARSRTLPDIVCPQLLDESNVDKAFEDLFKSS